MAKNSKKGATSANMAPANCGGAKIHCSNEYRQYLDYINHDLTHLNTEWKEMEGLRGRSLKKCFDNACEEYTQATGQKPQLGKVYRRDKKTNRMREIEGFAPIREIVVVIKEDTTDEEIAELCRHYQMAFGVTPLAFSIHRDEGHWRDVINSNGDPVRDENGKIKKEWVPNLHAHLFVDIMERREVDHKGKVIPENKRGRTIKFTDKQTSLMQDIAAEVLHMERGNIGSKRDTEQNNVQDYKKEQKYREIEGLNETIVEKETEVKQLSQEKKDICQEIQDLQNPRTLAKAKVEGAKEGVVDLFTGKTKKKLAETKRELAEQKKKNSDFKKFAEDRVKEAIEINNTTIAEKNQLQEEYDKLLRDKNNEKYKADQLQKLINDAAMLNLTANAIKSLAYGHQVETDKVEVDGVPITSEKGQKFKLKMLADYLGIMVKEQWVKVKNWVESVRMNRSQQNYYNKSQGIKQ